MVSGGRERERERSVSNYSSFSLKLHWCVRVCSCLSIFLSSLVFEGTPPEPGQLCEGEDSELTYVHLQCHV